MGKIEEKVKCERCGGALKFDAKSGCLVCENCKNKIMIDIQRATEQDYYADITKTKANQDWQKETKVIKCKSCGATEILNQGNLADVCPFCGSSSLEGSGDNKGLSPNGIIPFSITKDQAYLKINERISKASWSPKSFRQNFVAGAIKGVYTPVYTFDTKVNGFYSGRFGRTETRTATRIVNGKRENYTYSEVVWYNRSGSINQLFDDVLVDVGEKINGNVFYELLPFETNSSIKYDKKFLMGFSASTSSISLPTAFERAKNIIRNRLSEIIIKQNRAEKVSELDIDLNFNEITYKYLLLPVYTSSFNYNGKVYNIFVNGATGNVAGKLPISKGKVWATVILSLLIIAGIVLIILML